MNDLIKTGATISGEISVREAYTEPNQDKDAEWIALVSKNWVDLSLLRERIQKEIDLVNQKRSHQFDDNHAYQAGMAHILSLFLCVLEKKP